MLANYLKILPCAVAIAAIAVGCGGGNSTPALGKGQFIKQAEAICEKVDEKQQAALLREIEKDPKGSESQKGQEEIVLSAGIPPIQTAAEEIGELGAPEGDEEEIEAIVEGIEKAVGEAEEDPSAMVEGTQGQFAEVDKLAKEYGFEACANVE